MRHAAVMVNVEGDHSLIPLDEDVSHKSITYLTFKSSVAMFQLSLLGCKYIHNSSL